MLHMPPRPAAEDDLTRLRGQAMDIKVLKAEKRALKIKLRRFEDEFIRQNGQKPQSYQEVLCVRACVHACVRACAW